MMLVTTGRLISLLSLLVMVTSCQMNRFPSGGVLEENLYQNETWGFRFRIPVEWTIVERPDVAEFCMALLGNPMYADPLITCARDNTNSPAVVMCYVQKHTSAQQALSYFITSVHPTISIGIHDLPMHGRQYHHLQAQQSRGPKPYRIDLFAIDSNNDSIIIFLSQEESDQMINAERFVGAHFRPIR